MNMLSMILIAVLTFGVCFLLDRGYTKLFRSKAQHRSGKAVRVSKRYGSFGLILCILGIVAFFTGLSTGGALLIGGIIVLLIGIGLIVYYMSFGIFYDDEGFILTVPGRKSRTYRFGDIQYQQLYLIQGGSTVIELHLQDGNSVSVQSGMDGAYPFLDHAFNRWCHQTGKRTEDCPFHDPANSLWFPTQEDT